jgi:hypothetical protein
VRPGSVPAGSSRWRPPAAATASPFRPDTPFSLACAPPQKPGGYEGWHWIRDTQLHEDAHRYRGNGAGAMATLRNAAMNLLRLARRQPQPNPC